MLYPYLVTEISHLVEIGVSEFWVGGYGDFDRMAAQAVREVKRSSQHVNLILILAYLPVVGQKPDLQGYDNSMYPEGLENVPKRYAISRRNQWIVNNTDCLVVYVTRNWGGAAITLQNAKVREKRGELTIINLRERL